jgi:hypothetical protein
MADVVTKTSSVEVDDATDIAGLGTITYSWWHTWEEGTGAAKGAQFYEKYSIELSDSATFAAGNKAQWWTCESTVITDTTDVMCEIYGYDKSSGKITWTSLSVPQAVPATVTGDIEPATKILMAAGKKQINKVVAKPDADNSGIELTKSITDAKYGTLDNTVGSFKISASEVEITKTTPIPEAEMAEFHDGWTLKLTNGQWLSLGTGKVKGVQTPVDDVWCAAGDQCDWFGSGSGGAGLVLAIVGILAAIAVAILVYCCCCKSKDDDDFGKVGSDGTAQL